MFAYQEKITGYTKSKKTHFEESEQASEPDMVEILELLGWECKTIMINVLRTLIDKVDSTQEHYVA